MQTIINNTKEMEELAKEFAKKIQNEENPVIIALQGDLGSGKTTFTQFLAKHLGIEDKVTSPTFVIMKQYSLPKGKLFHIDSYRINSDDLKELDFNEIISTKGNIVIIEWAEKIKEILPSNKIWINFEYIDKDKRKVTYEESDSN